MTRIFLPAWRNDNMQRDFGRIIDLAEGMIEDIYPDNTEYYGVPMFNHAEYYDTLMFNDKSNRKSNQSAEGQQLRWESDLQP